MNVFVSSRPVTSSPFRPTSRSVQHQCIAQASKMESFIVSSVLTGTLLWGSPAHAEIIQTVSPREVSEMGAPLKVQKVEKKKVWLVFIIGASTLFAFTNIIENYSSWFPAVKRANEAMSNRRKRQMQEVRKTVRFGYRCVLLGTRNAIDGIGRRWIAGCKAKFSVQ